MAIQDNIISLMDHVGEISRRCGRMDPITVVAVTKYSTITQIKDVVSSGIENLGESRIQDALKKKEAFLSIPTLQWHLIGHLQTNKVKKAVKNFDVIQSVDSVRLLKEISDVSAKCNKVMKVLLQVNLTHEETKFGFFEEDLENSCHDLFSFSCIDVQGIMVMGPNTEEAVQIRSVFKRTKALYDRLRTRYNSIRILSMGMSHDYPIAIEEGATMIRIGSLLFI